MKSLNGKSADPDILAKDRDLVAEPLVDESGRVTTPEPQTPAEKPRRKLPKGLIGAAVGVGAIAAGIFGYRYWHYASTHESTDDAYVAGHVHYLSSRIPGTVTEVEVNDNQQVKKGELLVKLDKSDLRVGVEKAQAALLY